MSDLSSKYPGAALITGASAGLGESFARRCALEGMDLVLVARRKDRLDSLAQRIQRDFKVNVLVVAEDLSLPGAPAAIKAACDAAGVQVSMLINNAGFGSHARFHETDIDWQTAIIEVNCKAPTALTGLFLPDMVQRGNGAVVFLASTAAYQPAPMLAVYGASKAFNRMMGEALYEELKPCGVDVLSLSPGYTQTEFHNVAQVKRLPPSEMFRRPEEVVDTCFRTLGKQAAVIDKVTPFEAFMKRVQRKLVKLQAAVGSAAWAGALHAGEFAVIF